MLEALKIMIVVHGAVEVAVQVARGVVVVRGTVEVAHQEVMIEVIVVAVAIVVLEHQ